MGSFAAAANADFAEANCQPSAPRLVVADSFLVRLDPQGNAVAIASERHFARFTASVLQLWPGEGDPAPLLADFLRTVRPQIAAAAPVWPRLELWLAAQPQLHLALREVPQLSTTLQMRQTLPQAMGFSAHKGPNIARLRHLNRTLGAEALLLDQRGRVLEGATTSLLWWCGDTLNYVASGQRVASVTEAILLRCARALGISTRAGVATPRELREREMWAVNALHGIRVVSHLDGITAPPSQQKRLQTLRDAVLAAGSPL